MSMMEIRGDLSPLREAINRIAAIGRSPARILEAIGLELEDNTRRRFSTNVAPDGTAWAPLNPLYAESRKNLPILVQSGQLRRQIVSEVRGHAIIVGSPVKYAAVHQFGATIVPRADRIVPGQKKGLRFHMGGKRFDLGKVVIPARPYLGFGAEDREAVLEQLHLALELAMRGA